MTANKRSCENCVHSTFIDSGYVNCQRWAPEPDDPREDGSPINPVPFYYFCGEFMAELPIIEREPTNDS